VQGQAELLEVVLALGAGGGLAHLLHGGQEQADQHREDGDHHQQLDQREAAPPYADLHASLPSRPFGRGCRARIPLTRLPGTSVERKSRFGASRGTS
jgi:hypothetical protein